MPRNKAGGVKVSWISVSLDFLTAFMQCPSCTTVLGSLIPDPLIVPHLIPLTAL
jgi:hypothetical protein